MAWAEWEQLKAEAADKAGTQMRLNKAGPGGGGGKKGDLAVNQTDLSGVRDDAQKLHTRLWKEARVAVPPSETAAGDLTKQGFELGGALQHVAHRWDIQLKSLRDACGHIANHVDFTKYVHESDDQYVRTRVSSIAALDQAFDDDNAPKGEKNKADN
ncbi:hypothetical protein [Streptomyces sp. HB132]|uniref:hypothetical protein n=1 Tax=Streptomyces sp. HB132 TaxID=767388 RepID=UPI00196004AA|nr:hypothetical protein [Streptomyces sp. HB132]MBM7441750.1 hypothetical protein [Streptomyces sp. HB132]